jgi:hypothetical protein
MRNPFRSKGRIAVIGAAAALALAGAGTAFAYFTATGSATGNSTVGSAVNWNVSEQNTTGTMYPGSGTSVLTFKVLNNSNGPQDITSLTPVVDNDGATPPNIVVGPTPSPTPVPSCAADWFTATLASPSTPPTASTPISVGSGDSVTVTVDVTMTNENQSQDACEGALPDVSLSVN